MLTGGLSIGEALGLAVCDLDRKHSVVRVECQLGRDGTRTPLKTVVHDSMHLLEAEDPLRQLVFMLGPLGRRCLLGSICERSLPHAA